MEQVPRSPELTSKNQSSKNRPESLYREMYNLGPYKTIDSKHTNPHLQETSSHQGEETQTRFETDTTQIKALLDKTVLSRLKTIQTPIDILIENSPSPIDQAYYEAKALMTDMIEYPTKNPEEYYSMSKEEFSTFIKNKNDITYFQRELNTLNQYSSVYFHSNQYIRTDAFKQQTIQLYKDLAQKVLETYKDHAQIQAIWKHLHGINEIFTHIPQQEHYPTQEQFIQADIISDMPQQLTKGPAESAIQKKRWDITSSSKNSSIFELIKTQASDELTYKEIKEFYQEKLKIKLKNTVREGLEKLIQDKKAPLEPLEKAKDTLDTSQANDILHWEQLKPENLHCWCVQDSSTKIVYVGINSNNNVHKIEKAVIKNLEKPDYTNVYSKEFKSNFTLGTNTNNAINTTDKIAIHIDYYSPKAASNKKIHIIITNESKVFITDNIRKLSFNKYNDEYYIQRKKTSHPDPNWTFHEIDPW
jgi:hypothetical protein